MTTSQFAWPASVVALVVFLLSFLSAQAFTQPGLQTRQSGDSVFVRQLAVRENLDDDVSGDDGISKLSFNPETGKLNGLTSRRGVLQSALATTLALSAFSSPVQAAATLALDEPTTAALPNLDCLLDLPPLPDSHVRLYLCRHGQTDNNRLGLIQGARINPSINDVGAKQATRLGQALARLPQPPTTLFHSNLIRARDTAQTAANVIGVDNRLGGATVRELPALAEVDFGSVLEGESADKYRTQMRSTYVKWAMGDIDQRLEEGAESGREVFARIDDALGNMVAEAARCPTGSCAAVTHSAYLRLLLSSVGSASLAQVATMEQKNCCVNVVDVKRDIFPKEYQTVRVNEKRHLAGLV